MNIGLHSFSNKFFGRCIVKTLRIGVVALVFATVMASSSWGAVITTDYITPDAGAHYRTFQPIHVRLHVGYRDNYYPDLHFLLSNGNIGMGRGGDTGHFIGNDPNDPSIYIYEYLLDWEVPERGGVPFSVANGDAAAYQILAFSGNQNGIYYNNIATSDTIVVSFYGKYPNELPIPHNPVGEGGEKSPGQPISPPESTSWGAVKSLYR